MRAQTGDWLVVSGHTDGRRERRGLILEVRTELGEPPYTVRWLDDGHEALVFPGPDAVVVTPAEQAHRDELVRDRAAAVQALVGGHRPD